MPGMLEGVAHLTMERERIMKAFTREEVQQIRDRAMTVRQTMNNVHWQHAYMRLAHAADCVDALIARTEECEVVTVGETPVEKSLAFTNAVTRLLREVKLTVRELDNEEFDVGSLSARERTADLLKAVASVEGAFE